MQERTLYVIENSYVNLNVIVGNKLLQGITSVTNSILAEAN
jgi:hypothetical protein